MKRLVSFIAIIGLFAVLACNDGPITATPQATETADVTASPSATATPENTATATVEPTETAVPTATIEPTPTRLPPIGDNLLDNPGMEGAFVDVWVNNEDGGEYHTVAAGWQPFYCGLHYAPEPCPAPYAGDKNPADLLMRRPEYKPTALPSRVNGGSQAQQWFCFFGTCDAGVYQVVSTEVGQRYEVGAFFQSWANYDEDAASDFDNPDDVLNTEFYIAVNLSGDTFAFAQENVECGRWLASDVDGYDRYVKLSCEFVANSAQSTVFFGAVRAWPIANNDSYLDDAYVIAIPFATPTPIASVPTPAATPLGPECDYGGPVNWTLTTHFVMVVRDAPAGNDTGQRTTQGTTYPVDCIYSPSDGERWARAYNGWIAVNLSGAIYGTLGQP